MINSFIGDYEYLSNYFPCPVTYRGITYQNSEAAFQAQKCAEEADKRAFADLGADDAKRLGRSVSLRSDWDLDKILVMRGVVEAKFNQNPELKEKLLATGDEYLEEGNTWGDRTWGTVNGRGTNYLGRVLMDLRETYREREQG